MWASSGEKPVTFVPDSILPGQYLEGARATRPEHRLLLALLTDAWNVLDKFAHLDGRRAGHLVKEAWEWIGSDDILVYSYIYACEHLGIAPDSLRKGIARALERKSVMVGSNGVRRPSPRQRIKVGA